VRIAEAESRQVLERFECVKIFVSESLASAEVDGHYGSIGQLIVPFDFASKLLDLLDGPWLVALFFGGRETARCQSDDQQERQTHGSSNAIQGIIHRRSPSLLKRCDFELPLLRSSHFGSFTGRLPISSLYWAIFSAADFSTSTFAFFFQLLAEKSTR